MKLWWIIYAQHVHVEISVCSRILFLGLRVAASYWRNPTPLHFQNSIFRQRACNLILSLSSDLIRDAEPAPLCSLFLFLELFHYSSEDFHSLLANHQSVSYQISGIHHGVVLQRCNLESCIIQHMLFKRMI